MNRIDVINSHIHPKTKEFFTHIGTNKTNSTVQKSPQLKNYKEVLTQLKGNVASKMTYEINEGDILSKLHNNGALSIVLNRTKQLNSLSLDMVTKLAVLLYAAREDSRVKVVVVSSNSPVAFCAGGDIKALTSDTKGYIQNFFGVEFNVNYILDTFKKPTIALLNGITMGGGVGISIFAHYRVAASDKFVFAMPETSIGLFTDVGSGYFLPNTMPISLANYVAITSARFDAKDALLSKVVTHVASRGNFDTLKATLCEFQFSENTHKDVKTILDQTCDSHGIDGDIFKNLKYIEKAFDAPNVQTIVKNLTDPTQDADQNEWNKKTLEVVRKKCPMSVKVSFEALKRGRQGASLKQVLTDDFRLGSRMVLRPDFIEGVRAVVVNKTNDPKWDPLNIEQVDDEVVLEVFEPIQEELEFVE
ncbi:3-hydroxyisobutyryl-CoA hydrolase HIBCH [Acrasis kona]|uniref:3-hydroxyisobutyryl-CoA hydrolase HIBCH n=1 Tax=Acrasis kona TaxID=1008807 RepID=A0AAW2YU10_9EUKA